MMIKDPVGAQVLETRVDGDGRVVSIELLSGGSGYDDVPSVYILDDRTDGTGAYAGGTGATAVASIFNGRIIDINIVNFGRDYSATEPPTIFIQDPPSAEASATVGLNQVTGFIVNQNGSGYTKVPSVAITTAPSGGTDATAVAITTSVGNIFSVKEILLTNPGAGYTETPTVTIVSAGATITGVGTTTYGVGAAATATLVTNDSGIGAVSITSSGSGYPESPIITFNTPTSGVGTAIGKVVVNTDNFVTQILISDAGIGYTSGTGIATISAPPIITGIGTFQFNEEVTGSVSGAKARVKTWDAPNNTLKVGTTDGTFVAADVIVGTSSSARYSVDFIESSEFNDKYDKGDEIETEADALLDFSESNPFGDY